MIPHKQLKLAGIFEEDKPLFLSLLGEHINLSDYISLEFYNHFYASTGRSRKYSLTSLLWAVILQKIFSISTDQLLLVFLHYSQHLRDFCGFKKFQTPLKSLVLNKTLKQISKMFFITS